MYKTKTKEITVLAQITYY